MGREKIGKALSDCWLKLVILINSGRASMSTALIDGLRDASIQTNP
jgi:hypothetical protein